MTKKSERFEIAYNKIHQYLKNSQSEYKNDKGFQDFAGLLRMDRSYKLKPFRDKLIKYHDLRNAIVHGKGVEAEYIAEPHENVVKKIEEIANNLLFPPKALSISTKSVEVIDVDETIKKVLQKMENGGKEEFSQLPVYEKGVCVGMITYSGVSRWLIHHLDDEQPLASISIKHVLPFEEEGSYQFVHRHTDVLTVQHVFNEQRLTKNPNLQAIIITETGKVNQQPLGIVTAWDLISMNKGRVL